MTLPTLVTKQPAETRLVIVSFADKMATAEIISSINSVTQFLASGAVTTDLTISGQLIAGQTVTFLVAGGLLPARTDITEWDYKTTVIITTDLAQILEADGIIKVKED